MQIHFLRWLRAHELTANDPICWFRIIALSGGYRIHRFILTWHLHQTPCLRKRKCPQTSLHAIFFDVQEQRRLDMR